MPLDFSKAAELCTEQELVLVDASRPEALRRATAAGLRNKIARARTLQRKFRDLAARQAREARGKAAPRRTRPARGNARTVAKALLFGEVLKRFQDRAAKLEEVAAREAAPLDLPKRARGASSRAKPARAVATRRARAARKVEPSSNADRRQRSAASTGTRKRDQIDRSHATRLRGHQGSRNRRGQAQRDARR